MALSTTLSITDVGVNTPICSNRRNTIRNESELFRRHAKQFGWFCINGHKQMSQNSLLQIPRNIELKNSNSKRFVLLGAYGNGAKNVSEDTDDMYDDLFKKYGKVVYRSNDQKSPTAEVDDDAESLSFAIAMAKIASDVKAGDLKVLYVKPLVYWTKFFIIATAFSRPQSNAIGSRIKDAAEEKYGRIPSGDTKPNSWTLLDFGDVVIHIFLPEQREFYNLEEFYGNATLIDLPFDNQPPFRS